jgi:hypothetical protein
MIGLALAAQGYATVAAQSPPDDAARALKPWKTRKSLYHRRWNRRQRAGNRARAGRNFVAHPRKVRSSYRTMCAVNGSRLGA